MRVHFIGANSGNVTGSRYLIEVNGKKLLLDCGIYHGKRKETYEKNKNIPFDPKDIDYLILTHAHIDHSGNIPNLVHNGFRGKIFSTFATRDLCYHMLRDSAYIQEREIEYVNKKRAKNDQNPFEPLYTLEDAEQSLLFFMSINYDTPFEIAPGITMTFRDAGHILGSATLTLDIEEDGVKKTLAYTGDLGRKGLPILKDPVQIEKADFLITESTYGDRFHESIYNTEPELEKVVKDVCAKGGKLIIPAFSLERTQEVIYFLHVLWNSNKVPKIPIFVDSPLAGNVTEVFKQHPECFDNDTREEFINNAVNPFGFNDLKYTKSVEESKALNTFKGPCVIISAAGMCEHGRILHHLKNNVEDHKNTILVVGYMAKDTLGRKIVEKQEVIKIFGEPYRLKADVKVMDNFSGHADKADLLDFIDHIKDLKKIYLVHGELEQQEPFKEALNANGKEDVSIPEFGDVVEL
ncbi:MBL fold metallo-hydrolase [Patescibacteria group bacterium]|nr:MBL fold metallo-hydrolase [Patescibacteria group bacterium]